MAQETDVKPQLCDATRASIPDQAEQRLLERE